jgi:hypothetical protein
MSRSSFSELARRDEEPFRQSKELHKAMREEVALRGEWSHCVAKPDNGGLVREQSVSQGSREGENSKRREVNPWQGQLDRGWKRLWTRR